METALSLQNIPAFPIFYVLEEVAPAGGTGNYSFSLIPLAVQEF